MHAPFRTLSITEQEYEEAREQIATQLRNTTTEVGVPALPPKRRQVISYLTLLKQQTHSYEFPVDQYEPLYVAHTSPAVLPPPMPVKKRHSINLEVICMFYQKFGISMKPTLSFFIRLELGSS